MKLKEISKKLEILSNLYGNFKQTEHHAETVLKNKILAQMDDLLQELKNAKFDEEVPEISQGKPIRIYKEDEKILVPPDPPLTRVIIEDQEPKKDNIPFTKGNLTEVILVAQSFLHKYIFGHTDAEIEIAEKELAKEITECFPKLTKKLK